MLSDVKHQNQIVTILVAWLTCMNWTNSATQSEQDRSWARMPHVTCHIHPFYTFSSYRYTLSKGCNFTPITKVYFYTYRVLLLWQAIYTPLGVLWLSFVWECINQSMVPAIGWEGNRRSGVVHWPMAMRHRLSGISTYGLNGLGKADEHPA